MKVIFYHKIPNILLTKTIKTRKRQLTEDLLNKLFIKSVNITTVTIYYCSACFQISVQKTGLVRHLILRVPFAAFIHKSATVRGVACIPGRRFHNPELHRSVMMLSVYRKSTVFSHYTVDTLQLTVMYLRVENYEERRPTRCNNQMFIINFCFNMFRASLCPSSGEQRHRYCIWCVVLVLLDVVGSDCGALSCRM